MGVDSGMSMPLWEPESDMSISELDSNMSAQSPAIFLQQYCSSAVICCSGSMHARTGDAEKRSITKTPKMDVTRCMSKSYSGGRGGSKASESVQARITASSKEVKLRIVEAEILYSAKPTLHLRQI